MLPHECSLYLAFHHLVFFYIRRRSTLTHSLLLIFTMQQYIIRSLGLNSLFKVKSRWHERWALILLSDEDPQGDVDSLCTLYTVSSCWDKPSSSLYHLLREAAAKVLFSMVDNQVCLHAGTHAAESLHAYQLISIDLIVFLLCEKTLDFE